MENPIKMDDFRGSTIFGNPHTANFDYLSGGHLVFPFARRDSRTNNMQSAVTLNGRL